MLGSASPWPFASVSYAPCVPSPVETIARRKMS